MKTIPVSFLVAGFLMPTACLAELRGLGNGPPPEDGGSSRKPMPAFADAWKVADMDTDGSISLEEFAAMKRVKSLPEANRANLFKRLDKDGDAKLSCKEVHRGAGRRHDERPPTKRLWELDADQSGGISLEEFKAGQVFRKLPAERQGLVFKRLDTNGDGMITPKDRPVHPGKRGEGRPGQRPYRISDKDQQISPADSEAAPPTAEKE